MSGVRPVVRVRRVYDPPEPEADGVRVLVGALLSEPGPAAAPGGRGAVLTEPGPGR